MILLLDISDLKLQFHILVLTLEIYTILIRLVLCYQKITQQSCQI